MPNHDILSRLWFNFQVRGFNRFIHVNPWMPCFSATSAPCPAPSFDAAHAPLGLHLAQQQLAPLVRPRAVVPRGRSVAAVEQGARVALQREEEDRDGKTRGAKTSF